MRYSREDACRAWLGQSMLRPKRVLELMEEYGSAEAVYDSFVREKGAFLRGSLREQRVVEMLELARPEAMHRMLVTMREKEIGIVAYEDFVYPDSLRAIQDPPALLFYRGSMDCLQGRCLTIVGSRKASPEGTLATRSIARDLADAGVTIVSGLALGLDTAAHEGCLEAGGATCGVCACGIDIVYPMESAQLREEIVAGGGVLISEFPIGRMTKGWHFQVRNRILSGLSSGVLMMEAQIRSGSMVTVHHALDQGREVFAYPGIPGTDWSAGTHHLIREGARYFTTAEDVLEDLGWLESRPATREERAMLPGRTPQEAAILSALHRGNMGLDQLVSATGLEIAELNSALSILQVLGMVHALPGKTYALD